MPYVTILSSNKTISSTKYKSRVDVDPESPELPVLSKHLQLVRHRAKFYSQLEPNQLLNELDRLQYALQGSGQVDPAKNVWFMHKRSQILGTDPCTCSELYIIVKSRMKGKKLHVQGGRCEHLRKLDVQGACRLLDLLEMHGYQVNHLRCSRRMIAWTMRKRQKFFLGEFF